MTKIFTIGFSGKSPEAFLDVLNATLYIIAIYLNLIEYVCCAPKRPLYNATDDWRQNILQKYYQILK